MSKTKTPGLNWQTRGGKRVAFWIATKQARQLGYRPKTVRLDHCATDEERAVECRRMQADMLAWLDGEGKTERPFDGSMQSLIELYQTDDLSPFKKIKYNTRESYARRLKILVAQVGARRLDALGARDFDRWYKSFRAPVEEDGPERITQAYYLMATVRMVVAFGVVLEIEECVRLSTILSKMTFENGAPKKPLMTRDMVVAFRAQAHKDGRASLALATAIQFETALRQRDVIGEWEPAQIGVGTALASRGRRWTTGLIWGEHIDPITLVMTKPTSKSGGKKIAIVDLRKCPMVIEELAHIPPQRRVGPVIVSESTGAPYHAENFNYHWRLAADAAGLPGEVCNMHCRGGAITEALLAGAGPLEVRDFATHAELGQTSEYARATLEATNAVRDAVNAKRNKG